MEVHEEKFAVEVRQKVGSKFLYQIDVFETFEEAERFIKEYKEPLNDDEMFGVTAILYNEKGCEIGLDVIY